MTEKAGEEFLVMPIPLELPFQWAAGSYHGRTLREIKDNNRFVGIRCPQCKSILFPAAMVCPLCHVKVGEDWVELGEKGTVEDFAIVEMSVLDPSTGKERVESQPQAVIRLDGGAVMEHRLEEKDPQKLRVGMRVEAVFKPEGEGGKGDLTDILYFRTIEK